jgi:HEAT repeat protein
MKNAPHVRRVVLVMATILGAAGCLSTSHVQKGFAQNGNADTHPSTVRLLQEFKTAQYSWKQAEVGEKLVALKDKRTVPAMLKLLKSQDRPERCNAGRVLAGLGNDQGLFAVIAELKDKKPRPARDGGITSNGRPDTLGQMRQDRYYAAHVLGQIGDKRAVPALIEVLQDETLNYQAAIVLGHLGDERAIPALLAALERAQTNRKPNQSPNTDMKFYAAYGLMWLKHPRGLPAVAQCLRPERHEIQRRWAADALGEFGDKRAVPFLIKALQDKDIEVRVNAIMALGRIGDRTAVPVLKASLKDTSREKGRARLRYTPPMPFFRWMTVREAAVHALKQIGSKYQTSAIG